MAKKFFELEQDQSCHFHVPYCTLRSGEMPMANIDDSLESARRDSVVQVDAEEELRVLTALIGCIMVAEDTGGRHDRRSLMPHSRPPRLISDFDKAV